MKKYSFRWSAALLTAAYMAFTLALGCTACGLLPPPKEAFLHPAKSSAPRDSVFRPRFG